MYLARFRRKKNGNSKKGIGNMVWKVARELATPVSFVDQITRKDRETMGAAFNQAPLTQKLKIMSNIITGRMTGINLFPNEVQAPQTINFAGIFNRWTGLGAAMMLVYGPLAKSIKINGTSILPHGSKVEQLGRRLFTGGIFGGVFDAPGDGSKPVTGTRHIQLIGSGQTNSFGSQTIFTNTSTQTSTPLDSAISAVN